MKSLLIRPNMPKVAREKIEPAIQKAYGFLCAKYGYRFDDVKLIFTHTANRSKYYNYSKTAKIAMGTRMWTYDRKTVGVTAHGLMVGYELATTTAIIHELTHHIQNLEKRKMSEVETTQNEIDYILQAEPEWRHFLKPV